MKNMTKVRWRGLVLCGLLCSLLAGCAMGPKPLYYWGNYEQLIYEMQVKPGAADPVKQIDLLTTDIQRASDHGLQVPPGLYAHLGFMYAIQGEGANALQAFNQEKALYPESTVLIDGMLKRAKEGAQ